MITLLLDDEALRLPAGTTLAGLVALRGLAPTGIATAVNGEFVPRAARELRVLADGDQVLFFQAITGG